MSIARANALSLIVAVLAAGAAPAQAAPVERTNAYALLVGSNRGGPGQKDLRFAAEDARRVRDVLTQVGGYTRPGLRLLLDPSRQQLLDALEQVATRLSEHAARGEEALFLFYYSGHARARALNMGAEELELTELRRLLTSMPSTVTVAILDACQTGAISRVKGAAPAADFSYNSVNDLRTAGVAVMASSSASELSQEAETLRASYFTHHLVTGLRGAADEDSDGGVTLSEAYRYAYNRTLVATAATAVGKQHVTLETRLRGKGEMVLTYPAHASSVLELPAGLSGQVLVHREPNKVVVAELAKSKGRALRLALPGGAYVAFVRPSGGRVLRCELNLPAQGSLLLAAERCAAHAPEPAAGVKGRASDDPWHETISLEVGVGAIFNDSDRYNQTLSDFRFEEQSDLLQEMGTITVTAGYGFNENLSLHLSWSMLGSSSYRREAFDQSTERRNQHFDYSAHAIGLHARYTLPLLSGHINPYAQLGAGPAWGTTEYRDTLQASPVTDDQLHWGYHLAIGGGLQVMAWRYFGGFTQLSYIWAPVVRNELDEAHNSGGPALVFGLRGAL